MEFKSYLARLLCHPAQGGPRAEEALRDYRAMVMRIHSASFY